MQPALRRLSIATTTPWFNQNRQNILVQHAEKIS